MLLSFNNIFLNKTDLILMVFTNINCIKNLKNRFNLENFIIYKKLRKYIEPPSYYKILYMKTNKKYYI